MKKWIAAALLAASGSAMADVGPFYVTINGYCNAKKVFVTPRNQVYGYEIGCSNSANYPSFGQLDSYGNVVLSSISVNAWACMELFDSTGVQRASCSNGVSVQDLPVSGYRVSLTPPANAVVRASKQLPDFYEVNLPQK